jgi:hypothetical protein
LWINWPRDRYASVPVSLHLDLAEISGAIRFGVTRGHSFFSFLGDPLMRINVRNEVGKGAYKFKDFPQLSEYITKKLKAYVHNKIVHPHSHKFRLIWPRNWWPEGTQGEFGGDGEDTTSRQFNQFNQPRTSSTTEASASAAGMAAATAGAEGASAQPAAAAAAPVVQQRAPSPAPVSAQPATPEGPVTMNSEANRDARAADADTARSGASLNRDIYAESDKTAPTTTAAVVPAVPAPRKADDSRAAHNTSTSNMRSTSVASAASAPEASTTSSISSSGYQAMRSKVTTWMQNHSRRSSTADNEDHYHPLSKAAAQAAQTSATPAAPASTVSPQVASRRPSASEQMKALMASARQSNMFRANTVSANTAEAAPSATVADARAEKEENEAEAMFDRMALQSLTSLQREIVKDNLAWDLEVKNIVNRFVDDRKRSQTSAGGLGSLPNTPAPAAMFGAKSPNSSDYVPAISTADVDSPVPSYRTAQRCLAAHGRGRLRSVSSIGIDDASIHAPAVHPTSAVVTAGSFVEGMVVSPPRGRASRANSINSSVHGPPEPAGLTRCKSFTALETPDPQRRLSRTDSDAPLLAEERRQRSYSLDDFRPEVLDAMFRIHILEGCGAKFAASEDPQSAAGKYRTRPCIYPADPYRSVDDASYGYSTQRPMQFAQNKQPQYRPAHDPHPSAAPHRSGTNAAAAGGERSTFSSGGSSAPRTSANPLHGVDIAAKFAEFKAKHLNNRDLFPRKKEEDDFTSGMREALVEAEDDPDLEGSSRPSTSRASISGASSSSAALKYMSNMIRSKFNAAVNPDSAEKTGKGPA